jgi:hypothetical protein
VHLYNQRHINEMNAVPHWVLLWGRQTAAGDVHVVCHSIPH